MAHLKMTLIGNIGRDAEIRQVGNNYVISFSVAHSVKRKDANNVEITQTTWVNCNYWKDSMDKTKIAQYLKKGTQVFVEGAPTARAYTKSNGEIEASFECRVSEIQLLGGPKDSNEGSYYAQQSNNTSPSHTTPAQPQTTPSSSPDDDLPF